MVGSFSGVLRAVPTGVNGSAFRSSMQGSHVIRQWMQQKGSINDDSLKAFARPSGSMVMAGVCICCCLGVLKSRNGGRECRAIGRCAHIVKGIHYEIVFL
jgi:hypothetical protein